MVDGRRGLRAACITGGLLALASLPGPCGPLVFVALVPLFREMRSGVTPRRAALWGFVSGLLFMGASFGWALAASLRVGVSLAAAFLFAVPVLAAFFGSFLAFVAAIARRSPAFGLAAAPGIWVTLEYARSQEWLLSVPWAQLGYALADQPWLSQGAAWVGLYGLSFWVVAVNAVLASLPRIAPGLRGAALLVLSVPLLPSLGLLDPPVSGETIRVAAVQPHLTESQRRDGARFDENLATLVDYSESALAEPADLVAWPESAYQRPMRARGDAFLAVLSRDLETPILTGVWSAPEGGRLWRNAAVLASGDGTVRPVAEKVHPVPVYERAADGPVSRWLAGHGLWTGAFEPGRPSAPATLRLADGGAVPIGVLVCIDSSYPEVARDLRRAGARLFLSIANESQTGAWSAALHARATRLRAVENRAPLVRVSNDGTSLWIDDRGRVAASLPAGEATSGAHALALAGAAPPVVNVDDAHVAGLSAASAAAAGLLALRTRSLRKPNRRSRDR
jgi:apolipoprotein N-acyltransferase